MSTNDIFFNQWFNRIVTINYPLTYISNFIEVIPLPECAVFSWQYLMIECNMMKYLRTKTGCFSSWLKCDITSLPPTLRTPSSLRNGFNWWILFVLGTLFPALTACISFQKYLAWHILIISVSAFCNMEYLDLILLMCDFQYYDITCFAW